MIVSPVVVVLFSVFGATALLIWYVVEYNPHPTVFVWLLPCHLGFNPSNQNGLKRVMEMERERASSISNKRELRIQCHFIWVESMFRSLMSWRGGLIGQICVYTAICVVCDYDLPMAIGLCTSPICMCVCMLHASSIYVCDMHKQWITNCVGHIHILSFHCNV